MNAGTSRPGAVGAIVRGAWRGRPWRWLAGAALALWLHDSRAQTIDNVDVAAQGPDTVVRITFNATVRFLQQQPIDASSLYRITFDLVAGDEAVVNQTAQESKRVAAAGTLPELTLTYAPSRARRVKELTLELRAPAAVIVRQGPSSRTIDIVFAGRGAAAPAAPAALPPAPPISELQPAASAAARPRSGSVEIEAQATELMTKAREALAAQRYDVAVERFNQLLLLPPNSLSQEAQELVGLAWERAGDMRRAQIEYELYLKVYPQGEGAQRVAQRLASLDGRPAPSSAAAGPADATGAASAATPATSASRGNRFTGNIAQYYYGGRARSQSLVNLAAGIDQSTLTRTTESAIVTSVDLGGRYANTDSETRAVVRGTGSVNLVATSHNTSLLNAAYIDYKRNASGIAVRIGRQSSISGGLLGLFDGVSATYPVTTGWKIDLMGGVPANPLVSAPSERLLAAMIEADGIFDRWGGDLYLIDQTTEGISNRRAVGLETRYSDELLSMYSLVDYDILFRKVNAFSLQGSVQAPGQTTVTLLVDSRRAPSLQTTNALISSGATSLKQLLQMETLDEVRAAAEATSAQARQGLVSISRPINAKWQLAMDLRYSAIGALPAVGNFEATPATGAQYGATAQLTGSNLYSARDINNFNLSVLKSPFFKGAQLSYSNLTGLRDNDLTVEPSVRYYTQRDNQGVRLNRYSPGLRMSYRLSRRTSVLGEGIVEHSTTAGPSNHDATNSVFFYVGYRYELF